MEKLEVKTKLRDIIEPMRSLKFTISGLVRRCIGDHEKIKGTEEDYRALG